MVYKLCIEVLHSHKQDSCTLYRSDIQEGSYRCTSHTHAISLTHFLFCTGVPHSHKINKIDDLKFTGQYHCLDMCRKHICSTISCDIQLSCVPWKPLMETFCWFIFLSLLVPCFLSAFIHPGVTLCCWQGVQTPHTNWILLHLSTFRLRSSDSSGKWSSQGMA